MIQFKNNKIKKKSYLIHIIHYAFIITPLSTIEMYIIIYTL